MPLSTSSFESARLARPAGYRGIAALLVTIAAMLLSFEAVTRIAIERKSKVQRQVNEEYAEAIAITRAATPGRRQLLVVGNSLVGHGIDMAELRKDLPQGWDAHEFWIYNTSYEDWYFGLRRLLAAGSRPDAVAVVFAAMHWNETAIRGDYSAQYLFSSADIGRVQSEMGLDRSTASSLLFARFSKAFALRGEVRKVVLNQLLPDLPRMYSLFQPGPPRLIPQQRILDIASHRMAIYKELVNRYGVSLVAVIPPIAPPGEEYHAALRAAAAQAGVAIAMPWEGKDVPASYFADDVHLTAQGARNFSAALAGVLGNELRDSGAGAH